MPEPTPVDPETEALAFEAKTVQALIANRSAREGHDGLWDAAGVVGPISADDLNQYSVAKLSSVMPNIEAILKGDIILAPDQRGQFFQNLLRTFVVNEPSDYWLNTTNFGEGNAKVHGWYGRSLSPAELVHNLAVRGIVHLASEQYGIRIPTAGDTSAISERMLTK